MSAGAQPSSSKRYTPIANYVLVHGAYQGGWIWKPVAARLRAAGHTVHAPTLDGCAERHAQVRRGITLETHAQELAQVLFYEDLEQVVFVGTSLGGMVMCRAAELVRERISRLVFVDALALLSGERLTDIIGTRRPGAYEETDVTIGRTKTHAETQLFIDLDAATRRWAVERYTPHPIAVHEDPVELATFWTLPWSATVIRCRRSKNPPESHQRRTAARLNAVWHELDAGHYPMLSHPAELTDLLA